MSGRASAKERERLERNRVRRILRKLDKMFPDPRCALDHETPFQLVIATILSAQCTDKRVNMVTPALFARYGTAAELASAKQEDVEDLIRSTGFFRNKAKNVIACARRLHEEFGGEVPDDMDALLGCPGVARKTANVVLGVCFDIAEGVVVDTHVKRIANLLGLTKESDPVRIERDLTAILPRSHWIRFSHQIILHGRGICIARRPRCGECALAADCPSAS